MMNQQLLQTSTPTNSLVQHKQNPQLSNNSTKFKPTQIQIQIQMQKDNRNYANIVQRIDISNKHAIQNIRSSASLYSSTSDNQLICQYTQYVYNQYHIHNPFKNITKLEQSAMDEMESKANANNIKHNNNNNKLIISECSSAKKAIKISKKSNNTCKSIHVLQPVAAPNSPTYSSVVSGIHNFNNFYADESAKNTNINNNINNNNINNSQLRIKIHSHTKQNNNNNTYTNNINMHKNMPTVTPIKGLVLKKSMLNSSTAGRTKQRHYRSRTGVALTINGHELAKSNKTQFNNDSKSKTIAHNKVNTQHYDYSNSEANNQQPRYMQSIKMNNNERILSSNARIQDLCQSVNDNVWVSEFDCGSLDNIQVPNIQTPKNKVSKIIQNTNYANKFLNSISSQSSQQFSLPITPCINNNNINNYSICPLCSQQIPIKINKQQLSQNKQHSELSQIQQHEQICKQVYNLYKMSQSQLQEYLQWKINQHLVYIVNILGRTDAQITPSLQSQQHDNEHYNCDQNNMIMSQVSKKQYTESIMQQCQSQITKCIWFQQIKHKLQTATSISTNTRTKSSRNISQ